MAKRTGLRARSSAIAASKTIAEESGRAGGKNGSQGSLAADRDKPVGLSVRLEPDLHDHLRKIAFERRVSIHSLLLEGVSNVIERYS